MEVGASGRGGAGRADPRKTARQKSRRLATRSLASPRRQLQSRLRTHDSGSGGGGGSTLLLVYASGSPPTQPNHLRLPHRQPHARRGLTPRRHPYLRLGSSRPCPSPFPATKGGRRQNYEFRQRPRDPAAVFPGADGSRSSGAGRNRKRLSSQQTARGGGGLVAPPLHLLSPGGGKGTSWPGSRRDRGPSL